MQKQLTLTKQQRLEMQAAIVEARIQQTNKITSQMSEAQRERFYQKNLAKARQDDLNYYALVLGLYLLFGMILAGLGLGGYGLFRLYHALQSPFDSVLSDWGCALLIPVGGILIALGMRGLSMDKKG